MLPYFDFAILEFRQLFFKLKKKTLNKIYLLHNNQISTHLIYN